MTFRTLIIVAILFNSPSYALFGMGDDKDPVATQTTSLSGPVSYADAVSRAASSVVTIQTKKKIPTELHPLLQDPFFKFFLHDPNMQGLPNEQIQQGLGSGVIVDEKGYILTNNHVIKDASSIIVKKSDGKSIDAKIIGSDPQTDLAVLKIDAKNSKAISMGKSTQLRVGDVVLAIGNPFGIERTVTQGIVSATGSLSERTGEKFFGANPMLDNLIQTDASINPGNSGGALIDAFGNLVGINLAIVTQSGGSNGIGFAIPIDSAKEIMQQIIENGHIVRGWIGANLAELNKDIIEYLGFKDNYGVYIQATVRNGPAQKSGLLPGDVITKINGNETKDIHSTVYTVGKLKPGIAYPVEIFRRGEYMTFSVVIGERPKES